MRSPLISWSAIGRISLLPSLMAVGIALPCSPSLRTAILVAAILLAPVNLVAVAMPAVAGRLQIHLALVGIILALVVRALGAALVVVAIHLTNPNLLLPTVVTSCLLLLSTLAGEAFIYARRLQPIPSTVPTESARV
jgi:hypothetical protein